jgi:thiol-disulfide isomerase/thioredoxin
MRNIKMKNKMKRFILYIILFVLLANAANAQGFRIAVKTPDLPVDSLFISAYNYNKKTFKTVYGIKYAADAVFTDEELLPYGLYMLKADTHIVIEFLISDPNSQNFSIDITPNNIVFVGSKENTANLLYMKKIREYNQQMQSLELEYRTIMQTIYKSVEEQQAKIDTIIQQFTSITTQKLAYQSQVAEENKGTLLASIILSVMEVPPPPDEYKKDKTLYYKYLAEHFFYKYDFSDDRILFTPLANNKFQSFSKIISELDGKDAVPYVIDALRKSQASPQHYYDFFDYLEHIFGDIKSLLRNEPLYIAMLRYAIDSTYIDEYRKTRYLYELNIINKNNAGDKLPDFNLIMQNGDTSNLYGIQAERLLLFLQNPDCPTCKKVREKLKEMQEAVAKQKITVLTVYFEKDTNLWQNYLKNSAFPNWLHGWNYDLTIETENRIDIRSIPSLYLLDKNKIILKKDIDIRELETILE